MASRGQGPLRFCCGARGGGGRVSCWGVPAALAARGRASCTHQEHRDLLPVEKLDAFDHIVVGRVVHGATRCICMDGWHPHHEGTRPSPPDRGERLQGQQWQSQPHAPSQRVPPAGGCVQTTGGSTLAWSVRSRSLPADTIAMSWRSLRHCGMHARGEAMLSAPDQDQILRTRCARNECTSSTLLRAGLGQALHPGDLRPRRRRRPGLTPRRPACAGRAGDTPQAPWAPPAPCNTQTQACITHT